MPLWVKVKIKKGIDFPFDGPRHLQNSDDMLFTFIFDLIPASYKTCDAT